MCESTVVEMEDYGLNHYLHHLDDVNEDCLEYNDEYGCLEMVIECCEEIIWN
ncbi:MAG: hypothetical protein PHI89_08735 [Thiovulaceae bacterium]|nr:hypothetical protein [Sulfurimonadaceae bacterium]